MCDSGFTPPGNNQSPEIHRGSRWVAASPGAPDAAAYTRVRPSRGRARVRRSMRRPAVPDSRITTAVAAPQPRGRLWRPSGLAQVRFEHPALRVRKARPGFSNGLLPAARPDRPRFTAA